MMDTTSTEAPSPKVLYDRIAELEAEIRDSWVDADKYDNQQSEIDRLQSQLDAVRGALKDHDDWKFSAKSTIRTIRKALKGKSHGDDDG